MDAVVSLVRENMGAIGLVLLLLFVFLFLTCATLRRQMKKGVIILLVVLGLAAGYYLLTGKSLREIPADVSNFFGASRVKDEASHRYHVDPVKQYGEEINRGE